MQIFIREFFYSLFGGVFQEKFRYFSMWYPRWFQAYEARGEKLVQSNEKLMLYLHVYLLIVIFSHTWGTYARERYWYRDFLKGWTHSVDRYLWRSAHETSLLLRMIIRRRWLHRYVHDLKKEEKFEETYLFWIGYWIEDAFKTSIF